jgi:anti-sigma regulatory factor (Ser/Thr protein kinase)
MPAAGRGYCTEQLRGVLSDRPARDDVLWTAELIASELLTNAVRAGCRTARLTVGVHRDVLRIAVADDVPGLPRYRSPGDVRDGVPGGWGLDIVGTLTSQWGVERLIPGKEVWAKLPVPSELTTGMTDCQHAVELTPSNGATTDGVAAGGQSSSP